MDKKSKKYQCTECNVVSERKDWNDATEDFYCGDIISVASVCGDKNMYCICPSCGTEISGDKIKHIE